MVKNIALLSFVLILSCTNSQPTYKLIYEFESNAKITEADRISTIEVLKKRLEKFSSDYDVKLTNDRKIEITATTSFHENRMNALIANQGNLEFWELYSIDNLFNFLGETEKTLTKGSENDSIGSTSIVEYMSSMGHQNSPVLFYVKLKDTASVNARFRKYSTRKLLSEEYNNAKFIWGIPNDNDELPLYAAKSNRNDKAFITGEYIIDARQGYNVIGRPTIVVQLDELGSKRWERMTDIAFNQQTYIAIALNDMVYSAPGVTSGPIHGGNFEISGDFSLDEAIDLATILGSSKRIPKLKLLQSSVINK